MSKVLAIVFVIVFGVMTVSAQQASVVTVDITTDDTSLPYNGGTTIRWTSINATSCSGSGGTNGWAGPRGTSGSFATGSLTSPIVYTITCANDTHFASDSVTISVCCQQPPIPTPPVPTVNVAQMFSVVMDRSEDSVYAWYRVTQNMIGKVLVMCDSFPGGGFCFNPKTITAEDIGPGWMDIPTLRYVEDQKITLYQAVGNEFVPLATTIVNPTRPQTLITAAYEERITDGYGVSRTYLHIIGDVNVREPMTIVVDYEEIKPVVVATTHNSGGIVRHNTILLDESTVRRLGTEYKVRICQGIRCSDVKTLNLAPSSYGRRG